jgi:Mechanosensitive ion channel
VRYIAFGLALVLSIIVLSGVRNVDTIAGGAFLAIVLGFAVQRVLQDVLAGLFMFFENWFEVGSTGSRPRPRSRPGAKWLAEDLLPKLARERADGLIVHGPSGRDAHRRAGCEPLRARRLVRPRSPRAVAAARSLRAVERRLRGSRR